MSDLREERLPDGKLAVWLSAEGDRVFLRQVGEWLTADFGGEPFERFDGMDRIFWDFAVLGGRVTLRWEKGLGIAVLASDTSPRAEELVRRIASQLGARLESSRKSDAPA